MSYKGLEKETILRDKLAIERTYLAKERTILSYIRTGLALLGVAIFVYRFMDIDIMYKNIIIALFGIPGVYITFYGVYKVALRRNQRKEFEKYKKEYDML
jgi:putative membrane protein